MPTKSSGKKPNRKICDVKCACKFSVTKAAQPGVVQVQSSMKRSDRIDKRQSASTGVAALAAGAGHRSRHTGSGSTGCNTSASASASTSKSASRAKPGKGKTGGAASLTAKELVASFKTISYSKLPPPPQSPPPLHEKDDAFTLIDCMSVILGGGDRDRSDDKQRWMDTKAQINLEAALNTVSSVCGEEESRRRRRRRRRHQHCCHHHGQHHSHHHHSSHQRSPHRSGHGKQPGRRNQCSHRTPRRRRRRRCFESSECVATDPSAVHEATPTAPPLLDRALISVQRAGAGASDSWCRLFRCADRPQSLWALATRRLPALASPSPADSPTLSSTTSQHPWPQPQSQTRRRQPQNRGGGSVWSRRGASSNCNAEVDLLAHRRPVRRRSLLRRRQSGGEDTADESSVYISASVASPGFVDTTRRQRHLLTPPMRPCHRVRVPAGASAGQPPPKLPNQQPAAASAAGAALTRTAARTARSVSRQLRAALCNGRRRLRRSAAFIGGDNLPPIPPMSPQPPRLPPRTPPPHRPDANNNRRPEGAADSADFGILLRTLEKAQLPRRRQPQWHAASSIELLVDRAADSQAEPSVHSRSPASAGSGSNKSGASSATASSCNSASSGASSAGQLTAPHAKSAPPVPSGPSQRLRRLHRLPPQTPEKPPPTSQRGKIELISALAQSLLGLSDDLQDCISPIQGLQAQLRRANKMPREADVRKGHLTGRKILE